MACLCIILLEKRRPSSSHLLYSNDNKTQSSMTFPQSKCRFLLPLCSAHKRRRRKNKNKKKDGMHLFFTPRSRGFLLPHEPCRAVPDWCPSVVRLCCAACHTTDFLSGNNGTKAAAAAAVLWMEEDKFQGDNIKRRKRKKKDRQQLYIHTYAQASKDLNGTRD